MNSNVKLQVKTKGYSHGCTTSPTAVPTKASQIVDAVPLKAGHITIAMKTSHVTGDPLHCVNATYPEEFIESICRHKIHVLEYLKSSICVKELFQAEKQKDSSMQRAVAGGISYGSQTSIFTARSSLVQNYDGWKEY